MEPMALVSQSHSSIVGRNIEIMRTPTRLKPLGCGMGYPVFYYGVRPALRLLNRLTHDSARQNAKWTPPKARSRDKGPPRSRISRRYNRTPGPRAPRL